MPPLPAFGISCPTLMQFGDGVANEITTFLPPNAQNILLLRGAGTAASAPVRDNLKDVNLTELSAVGEPSVPSINALYDSAQKTPFDAIIACGGGAVMDTGKALAFCLAHNTALPDDFAKVDATLLAQPNPIPLIVLPTTAGTGAEVTSNAVLDVPTKRAKISLRGRALFPHTALIDPILMARAPTRVLLNAGLDAVTQIIEAYTSTSATPFSDALTAPQIEPGLIALRAVIEDMNAEAMRQMAWTATASGLALANGGLGAAHGIASIIGGKYGAPHGALCGRLLAPVLRQNLLNAIVGSQTHDRIDTCCAAIASVFPPLLGGDDLSGFEDWTGKHGLQTLSDFDVQMDDLNTLAEQSMFASSSRKNAISLTKSDFADILNAAL